MIKYRLFRAAFAAQILWFCVTCILVAGLAACNEKNPKKNTEPEVQTIRWDFDDLTGWVDGSQNTAGPANYAIVDGSLKIYTRPNTWDRAKVHTTQKIYTAGTYTWRVYVPVMGQGDQASIGAFLYSSDEHELDFEIGYGTATDRRNLGATTDDLIVFTTSQAHPYNTKRHLIKREQWYDLTIQIDTVEQDSSNTYNVSWLIDGEEIEAVALTFGDEISFYVFCSVENLTFLGDHIPVQTNYALFDYAEYTPAE